MSDKQQAQDGLPINKDMAANDNYNLGDDMLWGASEIALFLYGDRSKRRKVYHLAATSRLPHSKPSGSMICARKSVLLAWIEKQEARSVTDERKRA